MALRNVMGRWDNGHWVIRAINKYTHYSAKSSFKYSLWVILMVVQTLTMFQNLKIYRPWKQISFCWTAKNIFQLFSLVNFFPNCSVCWILKVIPHCDPPTSADLQSSYQKVTKHNFTDKQLEERKALPSPLWLNINWLVDCIRRSMNIRASESSYLPQR